MPLVGRVAIITPNLPFNGSRMAFWERTFLGNTLRDWAAALAVTVAVLVVLWLLKHFVFSYFRRFAKRTKSDIDDMIAEVSSKTRLGLLAVVALFVGVRMLSFPMIIESWAYAIAVGALLIQVALWGSALLTGWLVRYQRRQGADEADEITTVRVVAVVVRFAFFTLIALVALDNVPGVEVTSLIASLGVAGIAVALAVQNILGDLFASLMIALDKPFAIGDVIKVGDFLGTVESVGLKTTHVRSYTGEELIFSNSDLLGSRGCQSKENAGTFGRPLNFEQAACAILVDKWVAIRSNRRVGGAQIGSGGLDDQALPGRRSVAG